jgi:hypothetical protein
MQNQNYYDREQVYGYDIDGIEDIEFEQRLQQLERKQEQLQELEQQQPRAYNAPPQVIYRQVQPMPAPQSQAHIDVTSILCGTVIALIVFFFLKAISSAKEPR